MANRYEMGPRSDSASTASFTSRSRGRRRSIDAASVLRQGSDSSGGAHTGRRRRKSLTQGYAQDSTTAAAAAAVAAASLATGGGIAGLGGGIPPQDPHMARSRTRSTCSDTSAPGGSGRRRAPSLGRGRSQGGSWARSPSPHGAGSGGEDSGGGGGGPDGVPPESASFGRRGASRSRSPSSLHSRLFSPESGADDATPVSRQGVGDRHHVSVSSADEWMGPKSPGAHGAGTEKSHGTAFSGITEGDGMTPVSGDSTNSDGDDDDVPKVPLPEPRTFSFIDQEKKMFSRYAKASLLDRGGATPAQSRWGKVRNRFTGLFGLNLKKAAKLHRGRSHWGKMRMMVRANLGDLFAGEQTGFSDQLRDIDAGADSSWFKPARSNVLLKSPEHIKAALGGKRLTTVLDPESPFVASWLVLIGTVIVLQAVLVPLKVGFDPAVADGSWVPDASPINAVLYLLDAIYLADIFVQLNLGYIYNGNKIMDRKKIAKRYLRSGALLVDMMSIAPVGAMFGVESSWRFDVKMTRLLRLVYLPGHANNLVANSSLGWRNVMLVIKTLLYMMLTTHVFGALWFRVSREVGFSVNGEAPFIAPDSWQHESMGKQYLISMFWAVRSLTSEPLRGRSRFDGSTMEVALSLAVTACGIAMVAFIIGATAQLVSQLDASWSEHRARLGRIARFLAHNNISPSLSDMVLEFHHFMYEESGGRDINDVVADLPLTMRSEVALHLTHDILSKVPMFKNAEPAFLISLTKELHVMTARRGEVVLFANVPTFKIFLVHWGYLDVEVGGSGDMRVQRARERKRIQGNSFAKTPWAMRLLQSMAAKDSGQADDGESERGAVVDRLTAGASIGQYAAVDKGFVSPTAVRAATFCILYSLETPRLQAVLNRYPATKKAVESHSSRSRRRSMGAPARKKGKAIAKSKMRKAAKKAQLMNQLATSEPAHKRLFRRFLRKTGLRELVDEFLIPGVSVDGPATENMGSFSSSHRSSKFGFEQGLASMRREGSASGSMLLLGSVHNLKGSTKTFVINPVSRVTYAWLILMQLAVLYNFVVVPAANAFELQIGGTALNGLNYVVDILYLIDIAMVSRTAYFSRGMLINDTKSILAAYWGFGGNGIVDMLSSLPVDWVLQGRARSISRLNRLLRLPRLLDWFRRWMLDLRGSNDSANHAAGAMAQLVFLLLGSMHYTACIFWVVTSRLEGMGSGGNFQTQCAPPQQISEHWFRRYVFALEFVMSPSGLLKNCVTSSAYTLIFLILATIYGLFLSAYTIGRLGSIMHESDDEASRFRQKQLSMEVFARQRGLPLQLRARILHFFSCYWNTTQGVDVQSITRDLPASLAGRVRYELYQGPLRRTAFIRGAADSLVQKLASNVEAELLPTDQIVCRSGEIGHRIYIILRGAVEIYAVTSVRRVALHHFESMDVNTSESMSGIASSNELSGSKGVKGGKARRGSQTRLGEVEVCIPVATLGPESYFGEIAYFEGVCGVTTKTIIATEVCSVSYESLNDVFDSGPMQEARLRLLARRRMAEIGDTILDFHKRIDEAMDRDLSFSIAFGDTKGGTHRASGDGGSDSDGEVKPVAGDTLNLAAPGPAHGSRDVWGPTKMQQAQRLAPVMAASGRLSTAHFSNDDKLLKGLKVDRTGAGLLEVDDELPQVPEALASKATADEMSSRRSSNIGHAVAPTSQAVSMAIAASRRLADVRRERSLSADHAGDAAGEAFAAGATDDVTF